jgi:hypothetical protein
MNKYIIIASTVLLFSCGGNEQPVEEVTETTEEIKIETTNHGEEINEEGALTTVEFLDKFDEIKSTEIKLTAYIKEVCSKKGCWMMLEIGEGNDMRVTFKDYGFFVPMDAAGKLATVQGIPTMDTTDVATLKHYAEDANATQEEIDAITEPEFNYAFEATGVIIKKVITDENEK